MLEREEDAALAEIEAALRRDDPDFVALIESLEQPTPGGETPGAVDHPAFGADHPSFGSDRPALGVDHGFGDAFFDGSSAATDRRHPQDGAVEGWFDDTFEPGPRRRSVVVLVSILQLVAALVVTGLTTVVLGPNVGGLVGVVAITAASLVAYQRLRGCPGRRAG